MTFIETEKVSNCLGTFFILKQDNERRQIKLSKTDINYNVTPV